MAALWLCVVWFSRKFGSKHAKSVNWLLLLVISLPLCQTSCPLRTVHYRRIFGKSFWSSCVRFTFANLLTNTYRVCTIAICILIQAIWPRYKCGPYLTLRVSIHTYLFGARELDISIYLWFALTWKLGQGRNNLPCILQCSWVKMTIGVLGTCLFIIFTCTHTGTPDHRALFQ